MQIQDSQSCGELIKECADVCRMAGADRIYATGHNELSDYPFKCNISVYTASKNKFPGTDAIAIPTRLEQCEWWRQLYNKKMLCVFGAAPLSRTEAEKMICDNEAYCIYRECAIVGIGVAYGGQIRAVASVVPGAGRDVVLALAGCLDRSEVSLSVASINQKALALYRSLGFEESALEANWYEIFDC